MSIKIKTDALGMGTGLGRYKMVKKETKRKVKPRTEEEPKPITTTLRQDKEPKGRDLDVIG